MSRNTQDTHLPTSAETHATPHVKTPGNYTISPALPEHRQGVPLHEFLPPSSSIEGESQRKQQSGRNNITLAATAVFVGTFGYLIFANKKSPHVVGSGAMNAMSNNAMASRVNGLIAVCGIMAGLGVVSSLFQKKPEAHKH